ncbi:hypothetical protein HC928_11820 [bacterium]|nr:hypothetical protein [bacterium]
MSDTNNLQSKQENTSESQKGKSQPPKTPDIQFTKTYQRRYDSQDPQS